MWALAASATLLDNLGNQVNVLVVVCFTVDEAARNLLRFLFVRAHDDYVLEIMETLHLFANVVGYALYSVESLSQLSVRSKVCTTGAYYNNRVTRVLNSTC